MPQILVDGNPLDQIGIYAVQGVVALTKSDDDADDVQAGRCLLVVCTSAGNVKVKFADGSTGTYPVAVGLTRLDFAVVRVFSTGTTATATFENGF